MDHDNGRQFLKSDSLFLQKLSYFWHKLGRIRLSGKLLLSVHADRPTVRSRQRNRTQSAAGIYSKQHRSDRILADFE
jgi:hypothetical protein